MAEDTVLLQQIAAMRTALYYPYQSAETATQIATTIRSMGFSVSAKEHSVDLRGPIYDIDMKPEEHERLKARFNSLRETRPELVKEALDTYRTPEAIFDKKLASGEPIKGGGTGLHAVGEQASISHGMGHAAIEESAEHARFGGKVKGLAGLALGGVLSVASGISAASTTEGPLAAKVDAGFDAAGEVLKNATPGVNSAVALNDGNPAEAAALAVDNIPIPGVGDLNRFAQRTFALATGRETTVEPSLPEMASYVLVQDVTYLASKANEGIGKLQDSINTTVAHALGKNDAAPRHYAENDLPPIAEAKPHPMAALLPADVHKEVCAAGKNACSANMSHDANAAAHAGGAQVVASQPSKKVAQVG